MAEIKISELSIGDWVITQITDTLIRGVHDGIEYGALHKQISPIPLTSEILEKNGFVKDEEFICHSLECEEADFVEYTIGMNRLYVKSSRCDITLTIKYVHQLQHALRLAGVGKEIEV